MTFATDTGPVRPGSVDAWLVVIDAQHVFADPTSEWACPGFADIIDPVRRLAAAFGDRVVLTRWVPPAEKKGSWVPYFHAFPFADRPADDPLWQLVPEVAELGAPHVIDEPTFGKWGAKLREVTGEYPQLVLAGVATDCCVLATALPAADAGATVTIVTDACAGSNDQNHQRALDAMTLFAPQIVLRSVDDVLGG